MAPDDRALKILELWRQGQLSTYDGPCSEQLAAAIRSGVFDAAWTTTTELAGALRQVGSPTVANKPPYEVVDVLLQFDRREFIARVSFDSDERLAGMFILNPSDESAHSPS
jgi:hypothetical protein